MSLKTRLFVIALLLILAVTPSLVLADSQLEQLVAEALERNPELQAARQRWEMFGHKVGQSSSLDDPMLSLNLNNYPVDSLAGDETPMTSRDLVLSQKFPFPGKLAARGELAEQQALWYQAVYEDARLQLVRQVKDAYYALYYQVQAITIVEENLRILADFIRLTETRYQVGQGLQQDVLKAQLERSKLMDRLFVLRQQRHTAQANLDALLDRQGASPISSFAEPPLPAALPAAATLEQAEQRRPLFGAYRSLIERYKAQRRLAKLDYRPDLSLFAAYKLREENRGDDGVDFVSAGISLNLPIWRERRAEAVAEADSGIRMAHRQYDELRNRVQFNLSDAQAQLERNHQQLLLYREGIIPQASQTLQASLSAYQVGKLEFLSLLDAQLTLLRYQLDYQRVLSDYQRSAARLAAELGSRVDVDRID